MPQFEPFSPPFNAKFNANSVLVARAVSGHGICRLALNLVRSLLPRRAIMPIGREVRGTPPSPESPWDISVPCCCSFAAFTIGPSAQAPLSAVPSIIFRVGFWAGLR